MSLEKIYIIRHGFRSNWTVDPATGIYSAYIPSPTGIPADPALTAHGVAQAKELARHLMTLDPPIEAVYSSPFYRCVETLAPFMRLHQEQYPHQEIKIVPEDGIREWFGSAPFHHPQPATADLLKSLFPAIDDSLVSVVVPSSRGETLAQLQHRIAVALRGIIARCDADGRRALLVCTHAAVVIMLGRILTGQVPASPDEEDFKAFTCGLSVYSRGDCRGSPSAYLNGTCASSETDRNIIGGWTCDLNSDCSFLSGGEERGWKMSADESFPGTSSLSQGDAKSKF
ncbi:hypothetical protein CDD81_7926 [Ophiocordyceps australis]|uniref:Uncharacterized protein n=1 Tax=Ophiocordyceps australis TaxID=1399860 RepID=A0A2C5Y2F7_9HYPO|nr:hypothetical protein CDD81_7926 [Ophiocordyceps australis]